MIWYDSQRFVTLLRIRGSIFPKSMMWALPSAILAYCLRYFSQEGRIDLTPLSILNEGDIYSGFTFVLGFIIVFRTSQSYLRYWTAATSVHQMSSEWSDSCASLVAFSTVSKASNREIARFRHTVVRLYSLLHAMALSEISSTVEEMPLLDVQGLGKGELGVLAMGESQGKKVQIALSWIKAYVMQMCDRGLINVPPPILTRVFQELGNGLVNFHKTQQIVIWPFPFPYTQLNVVLLQIYTIITPVVVSTWEAWPWVGSLFTFVSVTCLVGLDLIACELENPFGDDPNDLPVVDMQRDMNKFLVLQLNPLIHHAPELLPGAQMDYLQLSEQSQMRCWDRKNSLRARLSTRASSNTITSGSTVGSQGGAVTGALSPGSRGRRMEAQMRWLGEATPESEISRLQAWLQCLPSRAAESFRSIGTNPNLTTPSATPVPTRVLTSMALRDGMGPFGGRALEHARLGSESPVGELSIQGSIRDSIRSAHSQTESEVTDAQDAQSATFEPTAFETIAEGLAEGTVEGTCGAEGAFGAFGGGSNLTPPSVSAPTSDWGQFLSALHEELREHLDNQLEVQRKELSAIEGLLVERDARNSAVGSVNLGEEGFYCATNLTSRRTSTETQMPSRRHSMDPQFSTEATDLEDADALPICPRPVLLQAKSGSFTR